MDTCTQGLRHQQKHDCSLHGVYLLCVAAQPPCFSAFGSSSGLPCVADHTRAVSDVLGVSSILFGANEEIIKVCLPDHRSEDTPYVFGFV
jgi:hypothetical protein